MSIKKLDWVVHRRVPGERVPTALMLVIGPLEGETTDRIRCYEPTRRFGNALPTFKEEDLVQLDNDKVWRTPKLAAQAQTIINTIPVKKED